MVESEILRNASDRASGECGTTDIPSAGASRVAANKVESCGGQCASSVPPSEDGDRLDRVPGSAPEGLDRLVTTGACVATRWLNCQDHQL